MGSNHRGFPPKAGSSIITEETALEARPGGTVDDLHQLEDVDRLALKIKVLRGSDPVDVSVPSTSTFGDLKRFIARETGVEPQTQKLCSEEKKKKIATFCR